MMLGCFQVCSQAVNDDKLKLTSLPASVAADVNEQFWFLGKLHGNHHPSLLSLAASVKLTTASQGGFVEESLFLR